MKTLEQLQDSAGELWPDIEAHLSQLRGRIETLVREEGTNLAALRDQHAAAFAQAATDQAAAVTAAKLAIQTNLDALVTAAEAAHASGDLDAIGAVIAQARSYTTAARRAKIEADLAAAQAAAAAHAAALAALA
jgi:hypothetical protein